MRNTVPDSSSSTALDQGRLIEPNTMIDSFRVLRLLGSGGMGDVYLARDTRLGRRLALKVISPLLSWSVKRASSLFLHEAQVTASLNHPNVVTIYAVGEFDNRPYLAMEYLEGQTLRERLREERPGYKEAVRVAMAIAEALSEAHRHGILHRDLKPENILMAKDGRLRVLDFGMAAVIRAVGEANPDADAAALGSGGANLADSGADSLPDAGLANRVEDVPAKLLPGLVCGTPAYMAPEQWRHEQSTEATDIWAFGVILYELLSGNRPYSLISIDALSAAVCLPDPVPRLETSEPMPAELCTLVDRCLGKDPKTRPPASEIVRHLEALLLEGRRRPREEQSPFRGLGSFSERHAELFYGRDAEVAAFLELVRELPVLPVVGPSGAGKSSFIQAGVIPRLREQGAWTVLSIRPGTDPFAELARRMARGEKTFSRRTATPQSSSCITMQTAPTRERTLESTTSTGHPRSQSQADAGLRMEPGGHEAERQTSLWDQLRSSPYYLNMFLHQVAEEERSRVLLFVDQLEEVYTLVSDEDVRRAFMKAICLAADDPQSPVRVVFTIRDDFLGRVADSPEVGAALARVTLVRRPSEEMLRDILRRPLETSGFDYDDPELVAEMIAAVRDEPACLPLLQFTCQMLWERRDRDHRMLRRQTYESIGGVAGALAEHADGVLAGMAPAQVDLARELFLRLVTSAGTRKVVALSAATSGLGPQVDEVLGKLTQARLLTVRKAQDASRRHQSGGEVVIELVHESLIHRWGRLARWLEESHEELVALAEIGQAAELWQRRGKRDEEVWQGDALHDARRKLARCSTKASHQVVAFLEAGLHKEARHRRRKRIAAAGGVGVLAGVALISLLVAQRMGEQRRQAEAERARAETEWGRAEKREAEAQREGARAAMLRGDLLEARAKLRGSLEIQDSSLARALWWRLSRDPLVWRHDVGAFITAVAFSPDGATVAAGGSKPIHLYDVKSGGFRLLRGSQDVLISMTFSSDGQHLAAGTWAGPIELWTPAEGKRQVLPGHSEQAEWLVFSPDGRRLASASYDRSVRLWDVATGTQERVLLGHRAQVWRLAFNPQGTLLASAGMDRDIRLWDMTSGEQQAVLAGHSGPVRGLAFSPDGSELASCSNDKTVRIWSTASGAARRVIPRAATFVQYLESGELLAIAVLPEAMSIRDMASGTEINMQIGPTADLRRWELRKDGRLLAGGGTDNAVRLWRVTNTSVERRGSGHDGLVKCTAFSPDGKTVASGGTDGTIRLWDATTATEQGALTGHGAPVDWIDYNPAGTVLASASTDATIRLWDVQSRKQLMVLAGHRGWTTAVKQSPDGKLLASTGYDKTVRLWDVASGKEKQVLSGHSNVVYEASFRPDGKLLASASDDGTVRTWDVASGASVQVLEGHTAPVRTAVFSADGRHVLSGGLDGTVRVWNLAAGTSRILPQGERVLKMAMHPDGARAIVTGSRVWMLDLASGQVEPLPDYLGEASASSPDGRLVSGGSAKVVVYEPATAMPLWRAPALLEASPGAPLELFSHRGWEVLQRPARHHDTGDTADTAGTRDAGIASASEPPEWRRAIEERALLVSAGEHGGLLCMLSRGDALEMWDRTTDRRLLASTVPGPGPKSVAALPDGCALVAADSDSPRASPQSKALFVDRSGRTRELAREATAIATHHGSLLVAAEGEVRVVSVADGAVHGRYHTGPAVSAMTLVHDWLAVGFAEGQIELLPLSSGKSQEKPSFVFEGAPTDSVAVLAEGPMETLIAGYAGGVLGIWDLRNGALLQREKLHGSVIHLHKKEDASVYAATDLGDTIVLDLGVFQEPYCRLLANVWERIPVAWESGLVVVRPIPASHRCARDDG
ncbi:MAG: protein kinase [Pseudomonadota bacterium]